MQQQIAIMKYHKIQPDTLCSLKYLVHEKILYTIELRKKFILLFCCWGFFPLGIGCVSLARLLSKRALPRTMVFCFAFGCNHRSDRHSKNDTQCHLFRFPTNVKLRKKWIELCRYVLGACF